MKNIYIRLPDDLHERLTKMAEEERRSLQKQVELIIEAAVAEHEQQRRREAGKEQGK